jgi:hypothetical protein
VTVGYRKAILKRLDQVRPQYFRDDDSIAIAAKHLNLDPTKAGDRERLLHILAEAIFAPAKKGRKAGVRPYWHKRRLIHLGSLYGIEKHENPKLKDAQIARRICKHPDFKSDDPDQLRQRLSWAYELFQEWWSDESAAIAAEYAVEHGAPDEFEELPENDF